MGFRFSRRIKIAKGLSLNFSKSGLGLSLGGRGGRITLGSKGAFAGFSIPGTGLSYRKRIGNSSSLTQNSYNSTHETEKNYTVLVVIDENTGAETITIFDFNNEEIGSPTIRRKLLRLEKVKQHIETLRKDALKNILDKDAEFIGVAKHIPVILLEKDFSQSLSEIKTTTFSRRSFGKLNPSKITIMEVLQAEAEIKIKTWKFWSLKRLRKEYIQENFDNRFNIEMENYQVELKQFESQQDLLEQEHYKKEQNRILEETGFIQKSISGDPDYIDKQIEELFSDIKLPLEFTVEWKIEVPKIYLNIDLPEIEDFPTKKPSILSSGKLSVKEKTQKEQREDYARCVIGLAFFFSAAVMNISPAIKIVSASGYTQRLNRKTGKITDQYLYKIDVTRDILSSIDFNHADPVQSVLLFAHKINLTKSYELKEIENFEL